MTGRRLVRQNIYQDSAVNRWIRFLYPPSHDNVNV